MKRPLICRRIVLLAATLMAIDTHADGAPSSPWSGSLVFTSDYLFRGISQTDHRPALQGSLEFDQAGGWYVGGWASNVSWLSDGATSARPVSNSLEFDAYAGKRGQFGDGLTWDMGLYAYEYPGRYPPGYTSPGTLEGYAALGWKMLTVKYSRSFGNLFGVTDSEGSDYVEIAWQQPLGKDWALYAHVGRQRVAGHADANYTDWKLGVTRSLGSGWSLSFDWHDTDARRLVYSNLRGDYLGRSTAILSLTKTF